MDTIELARLSEWLLTAVIVVAFIVIGFSAKTFVKTLFTKIDNMNDTLQKISEKSAQQEVLNTENSKEHESFNDRLDKHDEKINKHGEILAVLSEKHKKD